MRTLLAFTKQNLEDPEAQNVSPIGEDLREMLKGFHGELLRHSNHQAPEEDATAKVTDATTADAKQVSWTDRLMSLIISKQEEKPTGPVTNGAGIHSGMFSYCQR